MSPLMFVAAALAGGVGAVLRYVLDVVVDPGTYDAQLRSLRG